MDSPVINISDKILDGPMEAHKLKIDYIIKNLRLYNLPSESKYLDSEELNKTEESDDSDSDD